MSYYHLFLDETNYGPTRTHYCLLGLMCQADVYSHWEKQYTKFKQKLVENKILDSADCEFHLEKIKTREGEFKCLNDPARRGAFWRDLAAFVNEVPLMLTAAIVDHQLVYQAHHSQVELRKRMLGFAAVMENVSVIAQHHNIDHIDIIHEDLTHAAYKDAANLYLSNRDETEVGMVPVKVMQQKLGSKVSWTPKQQKAFGLELADMMANPLLAGYLRRRGQNDPVPEEFYNVILKRLAGTPTQLQGHPLVIRSIP